MFSSTSMKLNAVLVATSIASSGALRERGDNGAEEACKLKATEKSNNLGECSVKEEGKACSLQDTKPTVDFDGCCCSDTFAAKCGDSDKLAINITTFAYSSCEAPDNNKCTSDNMNVKLKGDDTKLGCCCTITNQVSKVSTNTSTDQVSTKSTNTSKETAGANLVSVWTSGCVLLLAFLVSVQGLKMF